MPDLPFAIEPNLYCSLDYYNILSHYSPLLIPFKNRLYDFVKRE